MARDIDLAALLAAAETGRRTSGGLTRLVRRCWPEASDATQPAARDWLRRWRPSRLTAEVPDCTCRTGTCGWCN